MNSVKLWQIGSLTWVISHLSCDEERADCNTYYNTKEMTPRSTLYTLYLFFYFAFFALAPLDFFFFLTVFQIKLAALHLRMYWCVFIYYHLLFKEVHSCQCISHNPLSIKAALSASNAVSPLTVLSFKRQLCHWELVIAGDECPFTQIGSSHVKKSTRTQKCNMNSSYRSLVLPRSILMSASLNLAIISVDV